MNKSILVKHGILLCTGLILAVTACKKEDDENINLGLIKVEANSTKGFQWPYYLNVPNS